MEAMKEKEAGLLHSILPPRFDDAGLEDCALPPDPIKEAFLKAATAVKSRLPSIFNSDEDEDASGECVKDPWPEAEDRSNAVVEVLPETEFLGACSSEKGVETTLEVGGDDVVVGGGEEKNDEVFVAGDDLSKGDKACVKGVEGLDTGAKKVDSDGGDNNEEQGEKGPILTEVSV